MEQQTVTQYKSVNLTLYFNAELDDGEVQDFIDRMTEKYNHPDDIISSYEYWYDEWVLSETVPLVEVAHYTVQTPAGGAMITK